MTAAPRNHCSDYTGFHADKFVVHADYVETKFALKQCAEPSGALRCTNIPNDVEATLSRPAATRGANIHMRHRKMGGVCGNSSKRRGPKGQRAPSPGQRPGECRHRGMRPERAKAMNVSYLSLLLPFQGAMYNLSPTQGAAPSSLALGLVRIGLSGRGFVRRYCEYEFVFYINTYWGHCA